MLPLNCSFGLGRLRALLRRMLSLHLGPAFSSLFHTIKVSCGSGSVRIEDIAETEIQPVVARLRTLLKWKLSLRRNFSPVLQEGIDQIPENRSKKFSSKGVFLFIKVRTRVLFLLLLEQWNKNIQKHSDFWNAIPEVFCLIWYRLLHL